MPHFFDIHSHLHFPAYAIDREEVIRRAIDNGVWMINVGTSKKTSQQAVALANNYEEGVYATIGLHPIHTDESHKDEDESSDDLTETEFDYEFYKKLALDKKVLAVGECGLDFFHLDKGTKERQIEIFKKHIELSLDVDKPLMLHIRDAYTEALEILKEYYEKSEGRLKGNVHFFAGDLKTANEFLALGFTLSFTGVVTYPKSKKPDMPDYEEIIKNAPIDMIMAETDAPYVAPMPFRGKRNESLYVREVVVKIAEIKGLSVEETVQTLTDNAFRVFGFSEK